MNFFANLGKNRDLHKRLNAHKRPGTFSGVHLTRLPKILSSFENLLSGKEGLVARDMLFLTLNATVSSHPEYFSDLGDVFVRWSEKNEDNTKNNVYVEHGWLPRTSYQVSGTGCNGRSHIRFDSEIDYLSLLGSKEQFDSLRSRLRGIYGDNCDVRNVVNEPFVLVALQKGSDFNLLYSDTAFSRYFGVDDADRKVAQAVIDYVEEVIDCVPVVFALHPSAVVGVNELTVKDTNHLVSKQKGLKSIDFVRSKNCMCVISINSNLLHEALLFDIPIIPLGRLLWDVNPFCSIDDWNVDFSSHKDVTNQYLAMLLCNQWYLEDFRNPKIVRELLLNTDNVSAISVRRKLGIQTL